MARILVVEDDPGVRDYVVRALSLHGHQVREASDGAEAAVSLNQFCFDAMISDIRMPVMDGITLALHAKSEQPNLKVMLMTGYASELQRAHNIGSLIDKVISKPFAINTLNEAVQSLFHEQPWMSPVGGRVDRGAPYSSSQSGISSRASKSSKD